MSRFTSKVLPVGLAAAAVLAAGGGFAALAASPQHQPPAHAAPGADPVVLEIHNQLMALAAHLAHGAEATEVRAKAHELAARYAAHTGEDAAPMKAHLDEMLGAIVEARAKGPEALHALMIRLFGEGGHG